jgi:hypothetical protein
LLQQWREVYAIGLHAATERWKDGQYEWNAFLQPRVRVLNGGKAGVAYQAETASRILVCPEDPRLPAVKMLDALLPDFRPESEDVLVWPEDLSWMMTFTHEESLGLGPYFARREWMDTADVGEAHSARGKEH